MPRKSPQITRVQSEPPRTGPQITRMQGEQPYKGPKITRVQGEPPRAGPQITRMQQSEFPANKYRIVQGASEQTKRAVERYVELRADEMRKKMPALDLGGPALLLKRGPASRAASPSVSPMRAPSPTDFLIKRTMVTTMEPEDTITTEPEDTNTTPPTLDWVDITCQEEVDESFFHRFCSDDSAFDFSKMQYVLTFGEAAGSITRVAKPILEAD
jgi:hypothetical protein